MVVLGGRAVSYERGTPVGCPLVSSHLAHWRVALLLSRLFEGYLYHKKTSSPETLQQAYPQGPIVILEGLGVSYERVNPGPPTQPQTQAEWMAGQALQRTSFGDTGVPRP